MYTITCNHNVIDKIIVKSSTWDMGKEWVSKPPYKSILKS